MESKLACLSLAALVFASCDKSGSKAAPDDTSSKNPQIENRADAPKIAAVSAQGQRGAPGAHSVDPPITYPVDASKIRPAGTPPGDASWETLTAEQMIGKFNSSGIARIPKNVSDKILADATRAGTPEDQVRLIIQQSTAWHHINEFKEGVNDIPEHMRTTLLKTLSMKHGDSWKDMVPEIDEQVAASARVMELRMNGIAGMSPDESQDFLIKALEKHAPDYKTILSIANQSTRK